MHLPLNARPMCCCHPLHQVLAGHLSCADAASCRLASKQLAGVQAEPSGSRLWVVAGTFTSQIQQDPWQDLQDAVLKRDAAAQGPQQLGSAPEQPCNEPGMFTHGMQGTFMTARSIHLPCHRNCSLHVCSSYSEGMHATPNLLHHIHQVYSIVLTAGPACLIALAATCCTRILQTCLQQCLPKECTYCCLSACMDV